MESISPRQQNWISAIILIAAVLIFWWRIAFVGLIPCIDDPTHLYENYLSIIPALQLSRDMLLHAQIPLWSPYSQGGMILFADPQYTIAYPLALLLYLLGTAAHFNALILLHFLIGGISVYFLSRKLKVSPAAALCSSFIYIFSFPAIFSIFVANAIWPWQWLPLLLVLAMYYLDTGEKIYCHLLALIWAMQMFIYVQSTFIMAFCFFPFMIFYASGWLCPERNTRRIRVRLLSLCVAIVIGTLMASVFLFPLWEYSTHCSYGQFSYKEATIYSISPSRTFDFFLSASESIHAGSDWALIFYMGVVGIYFFILALFHRHGRNVVIFFGVLILYAVMMSLGAQGPLYYYFYYYFPGAKSFHAPYRFLWLFPISFSLIAGFGLDSLLHAASRKRAALAACMPVGLLIVAVVGKHIGFGFSLVSVETLNALIPLSLVTVACVLAYVAGVFGRRTLVAILLCLIFIESYRYQDRLVYIDYSKKYVAPASVDFLRTHAGPYRFFSLNNENYCYPYHILENDGIPMLYPELSNHFQIYDVQARGPLHIDRYDRLIRAMNGDRGGVMEQGFYMDEIRNYRSRMIDLFGVKYILSKGPISAPDALLYDPHGETTVKKGGPVDIRLGKPVRTERIILKSYLEMASGIGQGETVAIVTLWSGDGKIAEYPLRAGINTAEGMDLNDPLRKAFVKHGKVEEWSSWEELLAEGKRPSRSFYKTALDLSPGAVFDRMEIRYIHDKGLLHFTQVYSRPEDFRQIAGELKRRFLPVFSDESYGLILYENRDVLPRAFLVSNVEVAPNAQAALERIMDGSFNVAEAIILEEAPPASFTPDGNGGAGKGSVSIALYTPNRIEMRASVPANRFLFISDIYYPGWETLIDGLKTKTYRADYAFRAVYLPAGEHTIVMRFRPRSVIAGGAVSLLAFMVIAVGLIIELRKRSHAGTGVQ
ncbi:MAG: YfhO family protein [Candidatus Aureabacteria bacterium]|nr:YfhO family protein [Candidatus Auribacterota bacterium]